MPGGKSIEYYKKCWPESILICLACGHEFSPTMEGRARDALTCSMECSKIFCRLKKSEKVKAKKKWRP
jgi:hypothetical protein